MSNEELPTFDLSQKKKKKSTKDTSVSAEEKKKIKSQVLASVQNDDEEDSGEIVLEEKKKKKSSSSRSKEATEPAAEEEAVIDFGKKKKSSKSKSASEEAAPESEEPSNVLDFGKKKKKSSKSKDSEETGENLGAEELEESSEISGTPWVGSDRDYKYSELTYRIYHLLQTNNPELISDQKRQMKTPVVYRDGSRKTVWANFADICQTLNRKPEHLLSYVFTELGSNGSVDGNQRLVIKGRFSSQQIEVVIRHYISEYVACRNCKSANTVLERNNRLYFLSCNVCNSKRSVVAIKKGLEVGKNKQKEG